MAQPDDAAQPGTGQDAATGTGVPAVPATPARAPGASAVVVWWAVALVVGWILGAVVGLVVGGIALATADDTQTWADLGAVILGILAAVATAFLGLLVAAVLLVRRFVPRERRTPGWLALLVAVLVGGAAAVVLAVAHVNELGVALAGVALAALVPVLVVARLPRA